MKYTTTARETYERNGSVETLEYCRHFRVLVIDDDPTFGKIMKRVGLQLGLNVEAVTSWKKIEPSPNKKVDGAIIDYDLGSTNGFYVALYLQRILGNIPVLIVSQDYPDESNKDVWQKNIVGFMHKNVGHQKLLDTLTLSMPTTEEGTNNEKVL